MEVFFTKRRRCSFYAEKRHISTEKSTGAFSDEAVKNSDSLFDFYLYLTGIFLVDSDRHEPRMTGTDADLPDTMSGSRQIFISGAEWANYYYSLVLNKRGGGAY